MLILTRKCQEAVVVGEPEGLERLLKVTVLEVSAGRVKLGFEAKSELPIHREEIWELVVKEARALNSELRYSK